MTNIDYILIVVVGLLLAVVAIRIWIGRRRQQTDAADFAIKSPRTVAKTAASFEKKAPEPAPEIDEAPVSSPVEDSAPSDTADSGIEEPFAENFPEQDDQDLDPLTLIKTFSAPVEKRINAIKAAGVQKLVAAVPALIEALYEPDQNVSLAATESLGAIGDPRAIEPLLEISRRSDSQLIKAMDGGQSASHPGEHEKVVEETAETNPYKFKEMVVFKIDQLPVEYFQPDGTPIPRKELVVKGLKDNSQQMRQMAAKAAIGLDSEEIVEPLIEALSNPFEVESVRFMAAEALGGMQNDKSVESLLTALKDENVAVRYSAAAALSGRRDEQIVNALIQAAGDEDKFVRSSVAYALGTTGEPAALRALMGCAADESEVVRFSAAKAIACFSFESVLAELEAYKNAADPAGIFVIIEVLGHIKDERSVAMLKGYLKNPDSEISYRASIALMGQENPDVLEELIDASRKVDEELRRLAEKNLNPHIIGMGFAEDNKVGEFSEKPVKPLEAIKNLPPNLEKLRKSLLDQSSNIRGSAANTLGDFNSQEALALLSAAAKDENEFVRASVVNSLGRIGTNGALSLVMKMEKDTSEEVRYAVVKALSAMPDAAGRECLVRMSTGDKSKNVKRAARLALEKLNSE